MCFYWITYYFYFIYVYGVHACDGIHYAGTMIVIYYTHFFYYLLIFNNIIFVGADSADEKLV